MVEDPERLKAQRFRILSQLDGSAPGNGRIPTVVLALPALARHKANLHLVLLHVPVRRYIRGIGAQRLRRMAERTRDLADSTSRGALFAPLITSPRRDCRGRRR